MAKKHNNKKIVGGRKNEGMPSIKWHEGIKHETKQSVFAVLAFAVGLMLTLAAFGKAGMLGNTVQRALEFLFGKAFFLVPLVFILAGVSFLFSLRRHFVFTTLVGAFLFLLSALGIADVVFSEQAGGYAGFAVGYLFVKLFDLWASLIFLIAFALAGILVMLNISFLKMNSGEEEDEGETAKKAKSMAVEPVPAAASVNSEVRLPNEVVKEEERAIMPKSKPADEFIAAPSKKTRRTGSFQMPPLDLLEDDQGTPSSGDIKANANIIKRTLQNFGIEVEMAEVNVGPSVTQYTLKPAQGVKLMKITGLQNDLALALAAHPLRIEAPIPGRSLVGIEIPNKSIALVGLRSLIGSEEFQKSDAPLIFALGRDVSGRGAYADLARMPHLLVAGATGSGKSVAIHSVLTGLLYRNPPDMMRLIIVDPKRVEMQNYSKIPHLLTPVITDAKKAIMALKWVTKEMEKRYEILERHSVRDIKSYHGSVPQAAQDEEPMPYIVVIVDELADLMATYPRELEASVMRLAQMSRAVGVHLIVSTQRPSVEVITGLIKANITSRIAFAVVSGIDSRTILDTTGAEKLLGNGDMLFLSGDTAKPRRVQGAFVSEKEVKRVTAWLAEHAEEGGAPEAADQMFSQEVASGGGSDLLSALEAGADDGDDVLYLQARELAVEAGKVSASYLQRRLRVGYARAARLLDLMQERGIIGPQEGSRPREVLIKTAEARLEDAATRLIEEAAGGTGNSPKEAREGKENFYESFS